MTFNIRKFYIDFYEADEMYNFRIKLMIYSRDNYNYKAF